MFTGIIQALGSVQSLEKTGGDICLVVNTANLDLNTVALGDSISVNGVCLTAVSLGSNFFSADVSLETINKTSLSFLKQGSSVNLETALTLQTALGGHLVSGHVDGLASVLDFFEDGRSIRYRFEVDAKLQHYIAEKGSVTIDGVSLTVNSVEANRFDVNIVPHTRQQTIFQHYRKGVQVNIEVDIIARYLERLINGKADVNNSSDHQLTESLRKSGFINQ